MYAYVRFIEDNVCSIVPTTKIKKFDKENVRLDVKYKVEYEDDGEYYPANIIYVEETIEDLETIINSKRIKHIKKDLLVSDMSENETDVKIRSKEKELKKNKDIKIISNKLMCEKILSNNKIESKDNEECILMLKKKIEEKDKIISKHEKIINEKEQVIADLLQLNIQLQRDVIDLHKDLPLKLAKMETGDCTKQVIEVGEMVDGEKVYIGQGQYLSKSVFDSCFLLSKSPSQFVKNVAVAIFGISILKNSSVTGKSSNRMKNKELARPALDPTKLKAVYEIFEFYLKKKGTSEVLLGLELTKIGCYISSKISDLNRKAKIPLKKDENEDEKDCEYEIDEVQE